MGETGGKAMLATSSSRVARVRGMRPVARAFVAAVFSLAALAGAAVPSHAAEFGTGTWLKGYTDVFAGVIPPVPGVYVRTDLYMYQGSAEAVIFNGRIGLEVEQDMKATILGVSYVTPWKLFGGTYAVAVAPTMVASSVEVGIELPAFTGPRGRRFGPTEIDVLDTELALGDTAFSPFLLGWHSGKMHWVFGLYGLAPTGEYNVNHLANTSLNRWAIMPQFSMTYFDPAAGWQASGNAVYSFSFKNDETDYDTGEILNLEGSVTKTFGRWAIGGVAYAMIQTTGDSGAGARLGDFKSRVYGAGPIVTYTIGEPTNPLTVFFKYYKEFEARNTFEGEIFDAGFSFKF